MDSPDQFRRNTYGGLGVIPPIVAPKISVVENEFLSVAMPYGCPVEPSNSARRQSRSQSFDYQSTTLLVPGQHQSQPYNALFDISSAMIRQTGFSRSKYSNLLKRALWSVIVLRVAITVSTVFLLALVLGYHANEIMMCMLDSGADDWRVMITSRRLTQIFVELAICSLCPVPRQATFSALRTFFWQHFNSDHQTYEMVEVPWTALLSLPMFLRGYLLCRFIFIHSKQYQDAATRSIAALNNTAVNFPFVMKTYMFKCPMKVLLVFTLMYWVTIAWVLTQCERYVSYDSFSHQNTYLNCFWFVIVTFMSIGYGDVVPHTYCGRTVAVMTGIVGAAVSSTLIAVIIRNLQLSNAERHVNNFIADSRLAMARKNAAATLLQHTWWIHQYKCRQSPSKVRTHQRKFLGAVRQFRKIKWELRRLAELDSSLIDHGKAFMDIQHSLRDLHESQQDLMEKVHFLTRNVSTLHQACEYLSAHNSGGFNQPTA